MNDNRHPQVPDKLYFRIGEVSQIVGVKQYVLRYWETEFPEVRPTKSKSGQRLYRRRDVESLLSIRKLLYDDKFTINGARKKLRELNRVKSASSDEPKQIEAFVEDIEETEDLLNEEDINEETQPEPELPRVASSVYKADSNSKIMKRLKKELEALLEEIRS